MKKIIAMALLVISFTSFAQEKNRGENRLSPEQQTELQIKKMTLDLDLNASQQSQIKPILLENNRQKEERFKKVQTSRKNNTRLSQDERFKIKDEMLDSQIALKSKMKSILSAEQFAKWEKMKEENPKRDRARAMHKKSNQ